MPARPTNKVENHSLQPRPANPHFTPFPLSPERPDDFPVRDVIIADNVVYDGGRDKVVVDGHPQVVRLVQGVSNVELPAQ